MNKHLFSVVISFSELAWIILLIGGMLYAGTDPDKVKRSLQEALASHSKEQEKCAKLESDLSKERGEIAKLEADLQQARASVSPKPTNADESASEASRKKSASELQAREKELATANADSNDLRTRVLPQMASDLRKKETDLATVRGQVVDLQTKNDRLQAQLKIVRSRKDQAGLNRDLIGLKGNTQRVVFVVDCSANMKEGTRWADAIEIIKAWIGCLDVRETAMVAFNQDVDIYPRPKSDGSLDYFVIEAADDIRLQYLIESLNRLTPGNRADVQKALQTAFRFKTPDTIILFTDGTVRPNVQGQILQVCRDHPGVRVNVVGVGNYFNTSAGEFLRRLAQETGGAFIGR